MLGSHLSIAGGLHNALTEARRLRMDCVQLFTQNQRQWRTRKLTAEAVNLWRRHRAETQMDRVISHGGYLVNPATPDASLRRKSARAMRAELQRCEALSIEAAVFHPGAHLGAGEAKGIDRIVRTLNQIHRDLPGGSTVLCLETTAGQGAAVGWRFEHLRAILDAAAEPRRLGICLDTSHMLAAGYDLTSAEGMERTLAECDDVIGLDRVRVVHLNDSKTPRGSRVDRHEHIGHGHIPLAAFAVLVNHPRVRSVPMILETPKQIAPDGRCWDQVNLETLRGLLRSSHQAPPRK